MDYIVCPAMKMQLQDVKRLPKILEVVLRKERVGSGGQSGKHMYTQKRAHRIRVIS